jgi:hypothetical protein
MDRSIPIVGKLCLFCGSTMSERIYRRPGEPTQRSGRSRRRRLLGLIVAVEPSKEGRWPIVNVLTALGAIDACELWEPISDEIIEAEELESLIRCAEDDDDWLR